jgi:hypothetical protein
MNDMNRALTLAVMLLTVALASPSDADGPHSRIRPSVGAKAHDVGADVASDTRPTIDVPGGVVGLQVHRFPGLTRR